MTRLNAIDESQIRPWRKNEELLRKTQSEQKQIYISNHSHTIKKAVVKPKKFRVSGGGRKITNEMLEDAIYQWIVERKSEFKHVSQKMIKAKAKNLHEELGGEKSFNASSGWCYGFLKRFSLSTRQKTHQSQRLPQELVPKVLSFFQYLRAYFAKNNISEDQVVAMDETCVVLENVSNRTISVAGNILISNFF